MAYSELIAERIRKSLSSQAYLEERKMFGGICFLVNGKMCVGVVGNEMMCRLDPKVEESVFKKPGCRPMDFTGRPMKGFVFVDESVLKTKKSLDAWIALCLEFNPEAKSSKRKKKGVKFLVRAQKM